MPELAAVLRSWRDRVSPAAAGLPSGGDRRSPGLRREELAALAGLSVDYVVRLEQGRATHPSAQVLGSLARALRLNDEERDHLFRVGGAAVPAQGMVPHHISPSVQRIVDRMGETPVAVFTAAWDTLLFNPLWTALFDPPPLTGRDANIAWRTFLGVGETGVTRDPDHETEFRHDLVADLHLASGRYPNDPGLMSMITDLRASSELFEQLWGSARIGAHRTSQKTVANALVGPITMDCDVLSSPGTDMKIVVYTVDPGTTDAAKLELLRVSAVQAFAVTPAVGPSPVVEPVETS